MACSSQYLTIPRQNNYDGTFRVVNALGHLLPSISAAGGRKSSKKSKGRGRGQKAKLEYQVRKKENRERRVQSNGSMDNTGNAKAHMSHIREVSDDTVSLSSNTCTHNQNSPQEAFNNSMIVDGVRRTSSSPFFQSYLTDPSSPDERIKGSRDCLAG